jgi:hypothetical protein
MSLIAATIIGLVVLAACAYALVLSQCVWTRRCPICRVVMRQPLGDRGPWVCPCCGWAA